MKFLCVMMVLLMFLTGCTSKQERRLVEAAGDGDAKAVDQLLQEGTDPDAVALDDWTPLTRASIEGHEKVVRLLLLKGADVNKSTGGITPLYWAVFRGHIDVARILVQHGGKLNLPPSNRQGFIEKLKQYNNRELTELISGQL